MSIITPTSDAPSGSAVSASVWAPVVGQPRSVAKLRQAARQAVHAYLFVGPPGSTKSAAARAFAVELLTGSDDAADRDGRLVMAGAHPDVHEVERVGASISVAQAAEIVRQSSLAPIEGERKVMILHEFHLLDANGAGKLLKTIEEPPASTHFVVLADFVPHDLVTIASRCVRIDFAAISEADLAARLRSEGHQADAALAAASAAGGDLDAARLLAGDVDFAARSAFFGEVTHALDGTGAAAVRLAAETLAHIESAGAPLVERQQRELDELTERERRSGSRASGRAAVEARHKREQRRHRTDELRRALAAIAAAYRRALGDEQLPVATVVAAVERLGAASEALDHNPNETLLLTSLFWSLPAVATAR